MDACGDPARKMLGMVIDEPLVELGFYRVKEGKLVRINDFCLECWDEGWREGREELMAELKINDPRTRR